MPDNLEQGGRIGEAASAAPPIFVRCEWGELKECVYGGYDQFVFPKFLQDADVRPSGAFRRFWFEHQEEDVAGAVPDYYARWRSQIKGAVGVATLEAWV